MFIGGYQIINIDYDVTEQRDRYLKGIYNLCSTPKPLVINLMMGSSKLTVIPSKSIVKNNYIDVTFIWGVYFLSTLRIYPDDRVVYMVYKIQDVNFAEE